MYDLWGWMMQNCIHPLPLVVILLAPPLLREKEGGKEKMSLIGADLASVTKWWRVMNGGELIDHERFAPNTVDDIAKPQTSKVYVIKGDS